MDDRLLLCSETNVFDESEIENRSEPLKLESEDENLISVLYEKEKNYLVKNDYLYKLRTGVLDLGIRTQALDWILKAHTHHSFGPLSFCLSISYLDRFLSLFELPRDKSWAVQLVAVTCLSIAIKVAESSVTKFKDLQDCGGPNLVFKGSTIQRMELLVLSTLNWKMQAYTPFSFIDYFLKKINDDVHLSSIPLVSRSIQLILSTTKGIDFLEFRPSEIAAAVAISVSTNPTLDIAKTVDSFSHLDKYRVFKCLQLIKDLNLIAAANNYTAGGAASLFPQSPSGVLDAASHMSSINNNSRDLSHASTPKRRKFDT